MISLCLLVILSKQTSLINNEFLRDSVVVENSGTVRDFQMKFDCPIKEGSIKVKMYCSQCNKINSAETFWFKANFADNSFIGVEYEERLIHNNADVSVFIPESRINYNTDTYILSYYVDSRNVYYSGYDESTLKCPAPSPTPKATSTPTPTQTPLPTEFNKDASAENTGTVRDFQMKFDCPIKEGSIKVKMYCSQCNKINSAETFWFKANFADNSFIGVEYEDRLIHNNADVSAFIPESRINYNTDTYILSYHVDSGNVYFSGYDESTLKCPAPSPTPKATPTQTPLPTEIIHDASAENSGTVRDFQMKFDCPIKEGSIKVKMYCSQCNKINSAETFWFKANFADNSFIGVEYEERLIHNNADVSVFIPESRINYNTDTYILSYHVDSGNVYFSGYDESTLKCPGPPPTPKATPTQSPSQSPTASMSPTASQSPTQSPTASRSAHPSSEESPYINNNFTGTIPVSNQNQIQVGGPNEIKQISGCRFTDLNIENKIFFIKVKGDASIFDNVFEYTSYTTGKAGCIWYNVNNGNKFVITNCKFIRVSGKDRDASVLNCNANDLAHIEFRDCEFIDCGEKGNDRPIVNILQKESTIEFYNCFFSYEDPQISRVLEIKGNGATFDGCRFNNCGNNSIDLGIEDIDTSNQGVFTFTNNYINSVNTRFINAPRIKAKPIINNNIFESCTLNGEFFIYILHNQNEIEFINNTFNNIISKGSDKGNCGGLSAFIERSGSKFKLIYKECNFNNIINIHSSQPLNQGGAIQYFSTNNYEVDIELTKCNFVSNKAIHHGGAVSIQTSGVVLIQECKFESNEANYVPISSKLLYENYYDLKTNGYGGAIYLNPTFNKNGQDYSMKSVTITGCTFIKNRAYQGYSIYIESETSSVTYNINNNNFVNNYENDNCPTTNAIIASEDLSLTKEIIESNSNTFSNSENGVEAVTFMRVDHKGNLLLEGNFSYGDDNFIPSEDPSDRIEKVLEESSANEVSVKVTVSVSEISSKVNDDGGAIHIVNCALDCTNTKFDTCKSPSGAGGGIYIKNTKGSENNANLIGLTFNKCEAEYGGAVYVYSNSITNPIVIKYCTFTGNKATKTIASENDSNLFGGSAIFLTVKKGDISSNIFSNNEGDGGAVRIYNNFNQINTKYLRMKILDTNNNEGILLISDCSFETCNNSECCLFYLRGSNGAFVELQKCSFKGYLSDGSHYIDGKTISNKGPKLLVKKCIFAYDSSNSVNMKDYLSIDIKDQTFALDKISSSSKKKLPFSTWMTIAATCIVAAVIVIVVVIVIIMKRKNPNNIEENEMSTEVRDLLLNESSTYNNDSLINSSLI